MVGIQAPMGIQRIGSLHFQTIVLYLARVHVTWFSINRHGHNHIVALQIEQVDTIGHSVISQLLFPGELVVHQTLRLQIFV